MADDDARSQVSEHAQDYGAYLAYYLMANPEFEHLLYRIQSRVGPEFIYGIVQKFGLDVWAAAKRSLEGEQNSGEYRE